jgi:membrane protein, related to actinobacillus protein (1944168)
MAASLSSDCMTNVAVFTITAFTLNLFTQKDKLSHKQTVALICIGVFLTLTKSVNALLLFPLLFLPKRLFSPNKNERLPFNIQKWAILAVTGVAAIISILIWQKIFGQPLLTLGAAHNPLHSNPLKFIAILFNTYISPTIGYTDVVLRGSVGDFSSFKYHLPLFVLIPLFSLLFLSILHYNKKDQDLLGEQTGKLAVYNLATIGLFVCAVSYAMYTAWALLPFRFGEGAYYADGVQGRYFTATAAMLVPVGLWLQKYINVRTKNEKVFNLIMFFGLALVLGFYIFETVWTYK